MGLPPIGDMLLFVDVVNQKSFTKAAKIHNLTSAALSKRIMFLESQLGLKLLNRSTRKLTLTESGDILYRSCKEIYEEVQSAYNSVIDSHKNPKGNIIISSPTNYSNLILSTVIAEFLSKYPGIFIKVILDDSRGIPERGEYDLAIRAGHFENSSVIVKTFSSVKFITCASKIYFEKYGIPSHPYELKQHNCIDYSYRYGGAIWNFKKEDEIINVPVSGNLNANNAHFIKIIALNGVGIVHLPSFMVKDELEKGSLVSCLDSFTTQSMPVSIIYPFSSRLLPKRLTIFIDFLMAKLKT